MEETTRDHYWRREESRRVETAEAAERFVEEVGFAGCLTDARQPGPSLYIAVCGRRDAYMPRNVQKDEESSLAWTLKDELIRRGRVYYGKLGGGKAMFLAPRMIAPFRALLGVGRREESRRLTAEARAVLKVLRREWEMGTADLRQAAGIADRKGLTRALDELQAAMIVVPLEVIYQPKFTYLWTLAEGRFPEEYAVKMAPDAAIAKIRETWLATAGWAAPGELARATGIRALG
ncbi:MAG: hypothetical protein ACKOB4_13565 [Acidobacteriota bacterium]